MLFSNRATFLCRQNAPERWRLGLRLQRSPSNSPLLDYGGEKKGGGKRKNKNVWKEDDMGACVVASAADLVLCHCPFSTTAILSACLGTFTYA